MQCFTQQQQDAFLGFLKVIHSTTHYFDQIKNFRSYTLYDHQCVLVKSHSISVFLEVS